MNINVGIINLPNAGSSSLLDLLSPSFSPWRPSKDLAYFTTTHPQACSVEVRNKISDFIIQRVLNSESDRLDSTSITYLSLPALIQSSDTHPISSTTLPTLKNMDVIIYLLRGFENDTVSQYYNTMDPIQEFILLSSEVFHYDMKLIQELIQSKLHHKSQENLIEIEILMRFWKYMSGNDFEDMAIQDVLRASPNFDVKKCKHLHQFHWKAEESRLLDKYRFLSWKSGICLLNMNELSYLRQRSLVYDRFLQFLSDSQINIKTYKISLDFEEKFRRFDSEEYRIANPLYQSVIPILNDLVLFVHHRIHIYTIDDFQHSASMHCICQGLTAIEAASMIHRNVKLGFVAAEVLAFSDLEQHGDRETAKLFGKVRQVGKQYIFNDGDIVQFVYRAPPPVSEIANPRINRNALPILRS